MATSAPLSQREAATRRSRRLRGRWRRSPCQQKWLGALPHPPSGAPPPSTSRNAPHDTTVSFLLFGWNCRSPTEAALLPVDDVEPLASRTTAKSLCSLCRQPFEPYGRLNRSIRRTMIIEPTTTLTALETGCSFAFLVRRLVDYEGYLDRGTAVSCNFM